MAILRAVALRNVSKTPIPPLRRFMPLYHRARSTPLTSKAETISFQNIAQAEPSIAKTGFGRFYACFEMR